MAGKVIKSRVAQILARARRKRLMITEIAASAGLSDTTISTIYSDKWNPTLKTLSAVEAAVFGANTKKG